jgi:hypothetical protein
LLSESWRRLHGAHLVHERPSIVIGPDMTSVYMTPIDDDDLAENMAIANDPKRLDEWRRALRPGTPVDVSMLTVSA